MKRFNGEILYDVRILCGKETYNIAIGRCLGSDVLHFVWEVLYYMLSGKCYITCCLGSAILHVVWEVLYILRCLGKCYITFRVGSATLHVVW